MVFNSRFLTAVDCRTTAVLAGAVLLLAGSQAFDCTQGGKLVTDLRDLGSICSSKTKDRAVRCSLCSKNPAEKTRLGVYNGWVAMNHSKTRWTITLHGRKVHLYNEAEQQYVHEWFSFDWCTLTGGYFPGVYRRAKGYYLCKDKNGPYFYFDTGSGAWKTCGYYMHMVALQSGKYEFKACSSHAELPGWAISGEHQ